MKSPLRTLLPVAAAFAALSSQSQAALIYDGLDYTVGSTLASQTGAGWAALNTGTAPVVASGNLSYTGLPASTGNMVTTAGGNFQEAIAALPASINSGTVYFSLLVSVTAAPTGTGTYSFALSTGNTNYGDAIWFQPSGAGYNIGVSNRSNSTPTYDAVEHALNQTVMIVGSYTFNSGTGDDSSSIWINPLSTTLGGATAPAPSFTATGGTDLTAISQFLIRGAAGSPAFAVDEIRVGTTWQEATSTVVPEASSAILGAFGTLALLRRRRA